MRTLVLNAGYEPLAVVSFKRALVLVMNEKAVIVEHTDDDPVWGTRRAYERPAVILLTRYVRVPGGRHIPVTGRGVLRRDSHRCAYCEQVGLDDRPRDAAVARRRGLLGEPRRVLPALQQRQGRPHAAGDELGPADHSAPAAGRAVDGSGHGSHRPPLGAVPRTRGLTRSGADGVPEPVDGVPEPVDGVPEPVEGRGVMGWAHDPSPHRDRHAARLRRPRLLGADDEPRLRGERRGAHCGVDRSGEPIVVVRHDSVSAGSPLNPRSPGNALVDSWPRSSPPCS